MEEKENRIRKITKVYYSNPKIQEALVKFSKNREVVPRYFEGFGKRPDIIQYRSDIMELVNKGATSFHSSEELWKDPLHLSSDLSQDQMNELRESWDLVIDIDSKFLDCSKIAATLIIHGLEHHGIRNYGIKFSGNKGFHIIIPGKSFPDEYNGKILKNMFPDWPRIISSYIMNYIRKDYNHLSSEILADFNALEKSTKIKKEELESISCLKCQKQAKKGILVHFECNMCGMKVQREEPKITKRKLKCLRKECFGILEMMKEEEMYYCEYCRDPLNDNLYLSSHKYPEYFEKRGEISAEKIANLDLVLVSPRHLFRMPYSLHEKTALSSIVIKKEEIENFSPKNADPMRVKIIDFMPDSIKGEAKRLLAAALDWRRTQDANEEQTELRKNKEAKKMYEKEDFKGVTEDMFPEPIKKLMRGLREGRKRGLFILLTFFRTLRFSPEYITEKVSEWNKRNEPPLKEGYIRSQLDWHFKQRKQILPPNYGHESFYRDLGLIDKKPEAKNPIVEVMRALRKGKSVSHANFTT